MYSSGVFESDVPVKKLTREVMALVKPGISEREGCNYLSCRFPNCMQKAVTSVRHSWDARLYRGLQLCVCVYSLAAFRWSNGNL